MTLKSPLRFNDGVEFNLQGELRIERRHDGLYVVGNGTLSAVDSYVEGEALIETLEKIRSKGAGNA